MSDYASELREKRISRKPFLLNKMIGIASEHLMRLKKVGITDIDQMIQAGKTREKRMSLSRKTGIPHEVVLELVKLSELSQIPGVKSIRSRLYYNSGYDTLEKLAQCQSDQLYHELQEFVEQNNFDGIGPLPQEIKSTIEQAKKIPKIVEY